MPAKAGIQNNLKLLDSRFRGNDDKSLVSTFYESAKVGLISSLTLIFQAITLRPSVCRLNTYVQT